MKKNYKIQGRRTMTPELFKLVKDRLGCNVIGFFLDGQFGKKYPMTNYYYRGSFGLRNDFNAWNQKAKKAGYFIKTEAGYDEYYVIGNAPQVIKTGEIEEKMTTRKMATIFSAKSTEFRKSRVILSRFIDLITKKL
jgi:hypothetical protein